MMQRSHSMKVMAALAVMAAVLASVAVLVAQQRPAAASPPQLTAGSPDALLGQALHQEEVEGRLEDAITTYKKVLAATDATREQKARAQFRIGSCYERLGLGEARRAYEAVVANYADQTNFATQAKARLAALAEPAAPGAGPVVRQISTTGSGLYDGRVSPDGRSVAGVDLNTGDLVVYSLGTGQSRRLTASQKGQEWMDYAKSPIWSRDGRQIAYQWDVARVVPDELRIADVANGTSRVVPTDARFRLVELDDWSPDGRRLLARVEEGPPENRRQHLAWVPTNGGIVELLASAGAGKDVGPSFLAPDGAWIVTRVPSDATGFSILAARGGVLRTLIPATASDFLIGWSADGAHVLCVSREGGFNDLMAVRVADGRAADKPILVRTLEEFSSFGISKAGVFAYESLAEPRRNLYRASFDATSLRAGPPARVDVAHGSVSWSPDGRRLAYLSGLFEGRAARTLLIWSADTGQTRSFSLSFKPASRSLKPTTWSADGRWVYVAEMSNDTTRDSLHRIDTGTGAVETVLPPGSGAFDAKDTSTLLSRLGGWSPDGRVVYKAVRLGGFSEQAVSMVVEHRVADHAERDLFKTDPSERWLFTSWQVSPSLDGSQLALALVSKGRNRIMVVPAGGGPAKTVVELQQSQAPLIRWMPDGRSLVLLRWMEGGVGMCDVGTGTVRKLELPFEGVSDVAVSPDGKEIAYVAGGQPGKEGVWMLENFLPPTSGKAAPQKK